MLVIIYAYAAQELIPVDLKVVRNFKNDLVKHHPGLRKLKTFSKRTNTRIRRRTDVIDIRLVVEGRTRLHKSNFSMPSDLRLICYLHTKICPHYVALNPGEISGYLAGIYSLKKLMRLIAALLKPG